MENKMNYTKAILLLVSGILSVTASILLGRESEAYGFLIGYGYTALAGGVWGLAYTYLKKRKGKRRAAIP